MLTQEKENLGSLAMLTPRHFRRWAGLVPTQEKNRIFRNGEMLGKSEIWLETA